MRYSAPYSSHDSLDGYLFWGLLFSLLVHVFLGLLLEKRSAPATPTTIMVDFISEPPKSLRQEAPRQIVSAPDHSEEKELPLETKLLAEKDFSTAKEQIKRGENSEAGPVSGKATAPQQVQPKTAPSSKAPPAPRQSEAPRIKQLALDRDTLIENFSKPAPENPQKENSPTGMEHSAYRAFSRPAGSGAAFVGNAGVPDYLPNLPDGDLTLLNAKADRFAVFVRRVATQVFANLRGSGWASLSMADVDRIGDFVDVRAILSPEGKLLRVVLESGSGSSRFDDTVKKAVETGARDPNPPKGAEATDGNIHFIFKARSWAQFAAARNGAPSERRWLLLGTGLE